MNDRSTVRGLRVLNQVEEILTPPQATSAISGLRSEVRSSEGDPLTDSHFRTLGCPQILGGPDARGAPLVPFEAG